MIGIVDLGVGNLGSIRNMLDRLGHPVVVSSDPAELSEADRMVLPGVGAFDRAAEVIDESPIRKFLEVRVMGDRVPVLGICLGMQLLARSSEEGVRPGLGWLDADVRRIHVEADTNLRVPHMGWNTLDLHRESPILGDLSARYYFVHSYAMSCHDEADVVATVHHGGEVVAAVQHGNVHGVQFHPEKSHRFGMALLERFASADLAELGSLPPC